jgi:hypothetical protein
MGIFKDLRFPVISGNAGFFQAPLNLAVTLDFSR